MLLNKRILLTDCVSLGNAALTTFTYRVHQTSAYVYTSPAVATRGFSEIPIYLRYANTK